jgi:hypothetical protein
MQPNKVYFKEFFPLSCASFLQIKIKGMCIISNGMKAPIALAKLVDIFEKASLN